METVRLFGLHLKLGVINEIQYRANFWMQLVQSLIGLLTSLLGLAIVFSKTSSLAGWGPADLLAVVGVYMIVGGLAQLIIQPSLTRFMEDVRQGTLDFTLTKPVDAQILISMRQIAVWKLIDVVLGAVVVAVAISRLGERIDWPQAASFVIVLIAGLVIVYSFLLILATCSFWFVRLDNILNIFQSMYEAGRWPIVIYPAWLRYALTFIVPIGFAITVPAAALAGRISLPMLLGAVALAIVLPIVSRWFWLRGLQHYSGASA
jgi:ABC-2 type transport system permease protein